MGGAEHDVWFDESSQRWLKVTKPSFGVYPSVKGGKWVLGRTTPAQYLEKLAGLKELFGVDTPVHGVLLDVRGNPSFIVSQADIAGEPVDQAGITKQLKESGFVMVADNSASYYRLSDNTMLFDAHPDNLVLKDGKLVGFDVGVIHPEGELKEMMERDHAAAMKRLPAPEGGGTFLDQARRAAAERGEPRAGRGDRDEDSERGDAESETPGRSERDRK